MTDLRTRAIESAARALCRAEYPDMPDDWIEENWREWIPEGTVAVDAALAVIAEPSDEMVEAGVAAGGKAWDYTGDVDVCHPKISFKAMIRKLAEG